MLTIITPCFRQQNLPKLYDSIKFDQVTQWIIVYDTSNNRSYTKLYTDHPKILEVTCDGGISGNPQRNYGLNLVQDGFIYFLDDDTIVHPTFWSIVNLFNPAYFYTFDQLRDKQGTILHGNDIRVFYIDTAMYVVHKQHIKDTKWRNHRYNADGHFICDIYDTNMGFHKYIKLTAAYYNYLV
jgi:hypothetical protein